MVWNITLLCLNVCILQMHFWSGCFSDLLILLTATVYIMVHRPWVPKCGLCSPNYPKNVDCERAPPKKLLRMWEFKNLGNIFQK